MNANPTNMTKRRFPMSTLSEASFFQVIPGFFVFFASGPQHTVDVTRSHPQDCTGVGAAEQSQDCTGTERLYSPIILTGSTWAVNRVWFFNIPRLSKKMAAMPPANPSRMDETKKAMANGHPKIPAL